MSKKSTIRKSSEAGRNGGASYAIGKMERHAASGRFVLTDGARHLAERVIRSRRQKADFSDLSDEDIAIAAASDVDNPLTDEAFWADAELVVPPKKLAISMRVDEDVLEFFKAGGRGYQTRMNAVLRSYMGSQKKEEG
ncbi:BrnA antitoxin family protein [Pseudomonadota bacterium]